MKDDIEVDDQDTKLDKIRQQIEFYLSDANIRKDKFIQQLLQSDDGQLEDKKFISLEQFLKFNRIKQLTEKITDLKDALKSSEVLELDKDEKCVRRNNSVNFEKNIDKCTVYVEKLPEQVHHDWLKNLFSNFGLVEHVSLPKFKDKNRKPMGFAFIEFDNANTAMKTCEFFSFLNLNKEPNDKEQSNADLSSNLIKDLIGNLKLRKLNQKEGDNFNHKKRSNEESQANNDFKRIKSDDNAEDNLTESDKNDNQMDEFIKLIKQFQDNQNIDKLINLRVISKEKWSAYKKEYFNLKKKQNCPSKKFEKTPKTAKQIGTKIEEDDFKLDKGLIVKLEYLEAKMTEEALFRSNLRKIDNTGSIAYIDLKPEINQCFIRFKDQQSAINYLKNEQLKELISKAIIIEGEEETNYWSTIRQSLLNKKKKKDQRSTKDRKNEINENNHQKESKPFTDYEKGLIIKLQMDIEINKEPNEQELKKKIKNCINNSYISYIDLDTSIYNLFLTGELIRKTIFIRCKSADCTKKVIESDQFKALGQSEVLENKEEFNYWQRIKECSRKKHHKK